MNRRVILAFVVVAVVAPLVGGFAAAQSDGGAGPYSLSDLRDGGTHPAGAPDGVRYLDGPGAVMVRTQPANPFLNDWDGLDTGSTVRTDKVQLYSTAFGEATGEYELKVVYWSATEVKRGNSTTVVAQNQTLETKTVELDKGYATTNVSLTSHFDGPVQTTMWLVDSETGQRVDGAQWRFTHHSSAFNQALPFGDSWSSFFGWFLPRFLLTTLASTVLAVVTAWSFVSAVGAGPTKGIGWWALVGGIGAGVVFFGFFADLARLVTTLPWLLGIGMGVPVFIVGIELFDNSRKVLFERPHITDVTSPVGESVPDIVREEGERYHTVPLDDDPDGDIAIFKRGSIRAALARYFAGPAAVPKEQLPTIVEYEGEPADRKVYVQQEDDDVPLVHFVPARWGFELPEFVATRTVPDGEGGTTTKRYVQWERLAKYGAVSAVLGGLAVHYLNPGFAVVAAALPTVAAAITARPAEADFNPAPAHATPAKAQRVVEEQERMVWDTFAELEKAMAEFDVDALQQGLDMFDAYRDRMRQKVDELAGAPRTGSSTSASGRSNGRASADD
jgi:hypothetical protein